MISVYIKDFQMPTSCLECPIKKLWADAYDRTTSCRLKFGLWEPITSNKRHDDCPLVEVRKGKDKK